ncbi:hypothetical protein K432DRAFT_281892, partial [Lepidopterella palustris CBS 459.81]
LLPASYFALLCGLGFQVFWIEMLQNETARSIGLVKKSSIFENREPLRTHYTGLQRLDNYMLSPVIFYQDVTSGAHLNSTLLLIALFSTMQSCAVCMQFRAMQTYSSQWLQALDVIVWGAINQAWGAAVIYPLWCLQQVYLLTRQRQKRQDGSARQLDDCEARTFFWSTMLNCAIAIMLVAPGLLGVDNWTRQGYIAYYRFTPIVSGITPILLTTSFHLQTAKKHASTGFMGKNIRNALIFTSVYAAACHLLVLLLCVATKSASTSSAKVFVPATTETTVTSVTEGAHRFLQYDWHIVAAALLGLAFLVQ